MINKTDAPPTTALLAVGAALTLTHIASYFFFIGWLPEVLADKINQYCWPGLPFCRWSSALDATGWKFILAVYLLLAIGTLACFVLARARPRAKLFLLALTLFKLALISGSYLFMGNYHFIPLVLTGAYLFVPAKGKTYLCILIAVYFFAGWLKLNAEWLSGAALGGPPSFVNPALFQWMLAYVVLLEMIFIFGIASERRAIRAAVLAQIFIFHAFSVVFVGWFYPVIMGLLWLGAAALLYEEPAVFRRPLPLTARATLIIFCLLQLAPKLAGDKAALDGRLRLASLNMFDARANCLPSLLVRRGNTLIDLAPNFGRYGIRIKCDPIAFESAARSVCRREENIFSTEVGLYLEAKTTTSRRSHTLIHEPVFCESVGSE